MKKTFTERKSKTSTKRARNREFVIITYLFVAVFIMMMAYFVYFQVFKSEDFINSPYNTRQNTFAEHVTRGEILSSDEKVLAQTVVGEDGSETRYYPYGAMFAHAVGYDSNGKSGVESFANFNLLRSHAFFLEQVINGIQDKKNPGDNVVTTFNYRLQETAYQALGGNRGAVIAMEPSTGKILAMVSKPDFDPNTIAADWESIISNTDSENSVLVNRVTQGLYPPGSTFKILTALEYIRENPGEYQNYTYNCNGTIQEGSSKLSCFSGEVHGTVDLERSFVKSCNTSFANIGLSLDADRFADTCKELLFNAGLPVEKLETSKSSFVLNKNSSVSEVMETAIGQGKTLMTPLHMMMIAGAVANNGVLMKPYVIDSTQNHDGGTVKTYSPTEYGKLMTEEEAKILQEYMKETASSGTASKLSGMSYEAYGKTGSAEFGTNKGDSHAWFVGYAHREDKEDIAIAVIVEGAGSGSGYAVPAAKNVFDIYYQ